MYAEENDTACLKSYLQVSQNPQPMLQLYVNFLYDHITCLVTIVTNFHKLVWKWQETALLLLPLPSLCMQIHNIILILKLYVVIQDD